MVVHILDLVLDRSSWTTLAVTARNLIYVHVGRAIGVHITVIIVKMQASTVEVSLYNLKR